MKGGSRPVRPKTSIGFRAGRIAADGWSKLRPLRPTGKPASAVSTQPQGPSVVPRDPRLVDGPWTDLDGEAVLRAQRDAARLARESSRHSPGQVLLGRPAAELRALVSALGAPAYRAAQLRDGVLAGARSLEEVRGLPAALRAALRGAGVRTGRSTPRGAVTARDGTAKLLLQLADGRVVECVGIPEGPRLTVCVSSQVGCPMRCTFCATGKGGFARNLLPHEILDQVLAVGEHFGRRPSNVVFMGMGEPMLNLPSVLAALRALREDLGMGARHLTLSTVGVPGTLRQLAARRLQVTLAVSLHAPTQELRERIVPSARVYPLQALMADCTKYFEVSGRRVSFEYTLMAGVNDQPQHAIELTRLLRQHRSMRCHVNLIPWNAVDDAGAWMMGAWGFKSPSREAVEIFKSILEERRVPVSVRITRGLEAAAACGQLRNMYQKTPLQEFEVPA
ncbi:putative dual-specificity RNA methyltransferase RlmN [Auxenochlorella protothecoides]|uniref:Putative dual-specificity RNA methyltransferase RlmN n=1 Tax=Auxenochlorella protothecoides TaxID=3075 RepID=A0A087SPZ2_AUXPR|nr:putative dual-specificity RNA methyltransferase RlmN [Auxenochlorella protothecoides]KFM27796.1 putative dual-specificity RNA methyltransferase RlmN [Auxenochlorella protothecoides]